MEDNKFYITTPIYYPSGKFHVGHCYCTLVADSIARYKRLRGYDVLFLTGTDEHGQKIEEKAKADGVTPKEYVDKIVDDTKSLWSDLQITYDRFIRTTDEDHVKCVQDVFQKLYNSGDIYLDSYEGKYCTPCESFFTESQLVDGKCPDCGREVKLVKEESYFFKLSKYEDRLKQYFADHPEFLEPTKRKNEMLSNFLDKGLLDLCVSRTTVNWGVPVPFDPKHTVYVWLDALINYITALGYGTLNDEKMKKYWPADLHLVGKEIFRFHSIIWPAVLMALDLPLPKKIFGHGWLVVDGSKISKSFGNYKDPRVYINETSVDALRYFLLREVTFGQDGNFSEELYREKSNSDLSNDLGNLVSRVTAMVEKYNGGLISKIDIVTDVDIDLIDTAKNTVKNVEMYMDDLKINDAVAEIWKLISKSNKYIDLTMPWVLAKDENKDRLNQVLYNLVETIRIVAILLKPYMVEVPGKIFEQIKVEDEIQTWESAKQFGALKEGTKVQKGINLFPRIEIKKEEKTEIVKVEEVKEEKANLITIDELDKVELTVGKILEVERVEKSDKLYKLQVDIGREVRTIVSGIVPYYTESALLNKKVVVVTNLKPAKLRGILSNGMLLAAGEETVKLLTIDGDIEAGSNIR